MLNPSPLDSLAMLGKLLSEVFTVFTALTKTVSAYSTALSESLQYLLNKVLSGIIQFCRMHCQELYSIVL